LPKSQQSSRLPMLDALRGIAAIAVMAHHEPAYFGSAEWFPRAYLAVDFFFLLSGFVLARAYEPRFAAGMTAGRFMDERIRRLWPMIAVGLCIGALAQLLHGGGAATLPALFVMLLLVPILHGDGAIYFLNGPMWSLGFELVANLVHATALRRMGTSALPAFIVLCAAGLALVAMHFGRVGVGDVTGNWWGGFARVGFSYALGIWLGRRFAASPPRTVVPWPLPVAGLLAILAFSQHLPLTQGVGDWLLVVFAMPPLLWIAAATRVPVALVPAMDRLGQLSYPVYAIHVPLLALCTVMARAAGLHHAPVLGVAAMAIIVALAWGLAQSPLARGLPARKRTAPSHTAIGAAPLGG
jgi:peptidoglycan/LPS O-acetylase OafA/YrhL